ncbi:hypothetical protein TNCV_4472901 [Trichonephila clavipes]|uniref:Uncharacterized protein n=1 Tax=Trichonephila clavipes TaxID=2585209 RepID=A0A8X6SLK8_TRICX|nr:hypothetical protein TNCV_4472901 [Trichonephila clavipes]
MSRVGKNDLSLIVKETKITDSRNLDFIGINDLNETYSLRENIKKTPEESCLLMGGRRSPKLQRQFVHLPCLQETDFLRNLGVPQVNGLYGGRSCILAQLVGQSVL